MADPQDAPPPGGPAAIPDRIGGFLRDGLGLFGKGVGTISDALKSMDSAVQQVDAGLTGGRGPSPSPPPVSPEQLAALLRQGAAAAGTEGLQAPAAMGYFQEALRLVSASTSIATRALRGSMALSRLAAGTGTLGDLAEVQAAADQMLGVIHSVSATENPEPPASDAVAEKPRASRRRSRKKPEAGPPAANPPAGNPAPAAPEDSRRDAVLLAEEVAKVIKNPDVTDWAHQFRDGKVTEEFWVNSVSWWCADNNVDLGKIVDQAVPRAEARRGAGG
jgi:hypothetical protein